MRVVRALAAALLSVVGFIAMALVLRSMGHRLQTGVVKMTTTTTTMQRRDSPASDEQVVVGACHVYLAAYQDARTRASAQPRSSGGANTESAADEWNASDQAALVQAVHLLRTVSTGPWQSLAAEAERTALLGQPDGPPSAAERTALEDLATACQGR